MPADTAPMSSGTAILVGGTIGLSTTTVATPGVVLPDGSATV